MASYTVGCAYIRHLPGNILHITIAGSEMYVCLPALADVEFHMTEDVPHIRFVSVSGAKTDEQRVASESLDDAEAFVQHIRGRLLPPEMQYDADDDHLVLLWQCWHGKSIQATYLQGHKRIHCHPTDSEAKNVWVDLAS